MPIPAGRCRGLDKVWTISNAGAHVEIEDRSAGLEAVRLIRFGSQKRQSTRFYSEVGVAGQPGRCRAARSADSRNKDAGVERGFRWECDMYFIMGCDSSSSLAYVILSSAVIFVLNFRAPVLPVTLVRCTTRFRAGDVCNRVLCSG